MAVVLRLPHLVLAHVGGHDRLPAGHAPDVVDDVRRVELAHVGQVLDVADRGVPLEAPDGPEPLRAVAGLDHRQQVGQHRGEIAGERHVHPDVLVELGRINVNVDLGRVRRVGLEAAGHPVVEAHAERQQQVGFLDRLVDPRLAVHAHHSHVERVVRRNRPDSQQRHGDRDAGALGEFADLPHRSRDEDAVPGEDDRALRPVDEFRRPPQLGFRRPGFGPVAGKIHLPEARTLRGEGLLGVLRDVHQHRSRTAGAGDVERLVERRRDVVHIGHQVVVLGDGQGDAGHVRLLEGVGADERAADLTGDADDGRRVEHGGGDSGDHVGRPGPGGRDGDPHLAGRPGVAVGHVGSALLVAYQDVPDGIVQHRVVRRQDGAAGIPEHRVHPLVQQGLPDELRSGSPPAFRHGAFSGPSPGVRPG